MSGRFRLEFVCDGMCCGRGGTSGIGISGGFGRCVTCVNCGCLGLLGSGCSFRDAWYVCCGSLVCVDPCSDGWRSIDGLLNTLSNGLLLNSRATSIGGFMLTSVAVELPSLLLLSP